jgi:hypothetical protein
MVAEQQNFAGAAVIAALTADIDAATDTIHVTSTAGWPASGLPFVVTIDQGDPNKQESVFVRSYTGTTVTLDSGKGRGYDGTTEQGHTAGANVTHTPDAMFLADLSARAFAVSAQGDIPVVANATGVQMGRVAMGAHYTVLAAGGSGVPVYQASFQSVCVATGDIVYAGSPNTMTRLAAGTAGTTLGSNGPGTAPTWGHDPTIAAEVTRAEAAEATLTTAITAETTRAEAAEPAAFLTTTGDVLYASAPNVPARLAVGAVRTVLTSTGTLPSWATTYALIPIAKSADYNPAVNNDLVQMSGQHTVTLPAPSTANLVIGVISVNGTGAAPCTVSTPSGHILGPGVAASATSILLGSAGAFVVLVSDGTNWNIVAGAQDSGWLANGSVNYRLTANVVRVYCTGTVTSATSLGTIPTGYRPAVALTFPLWGGTGTLCKLDVATNGAVTGSAAGGGSTVIGVNPAVFTYTLD